MTFDFEEFDNQGPESTELERIDTQETARDQKTTASPIKIDLDACDDTGACVLVCPEDVIEAVNHRSAIVRPEACTECWICVENCPSAAIEMT
jgi:ferredoxin